MLGQLNVSQLVNINRTIILTTTGDNYSQRLIQFTYNNIKMHGSEAS